MDGSGGDVWIRDTPGRRLNHVVGVEDAPDGRDPCGGRACCCARAYTRGRGSASEYEASCAAAEGPDGLSADGGECIERRWFDGARQRVDAINIRSVRQPQ